MATRVLMVCLGNICRSPMAAAVLDNRARTAGVDVVVASAGTAAWHAGEGPNPMSEQVWSEAGYRYTHIAQQFSPHMFDEYDYILVMDQSNFRNVLAQAQSIEDGQKVRYLRSFDSDLTHVDQQSEEAHQLVVPDPWQQPQEEFQKVLAMIERSVDGLLEVIR